MATLAGAIIRPDEHTKVDNIDDSDTPSREVEEKMILAKAVNSAECEWADIQCADAVIASVIHWLEGGKKGASQQPSPKTPQRQTIKV